LYKSRQLHARRTTRLLLFGLGIALAAASAADPRTPTAWLKFGGEVRGRAEGLTGVGYQPGSNDAYYLHRLRLNASITPKPWLHIFAETQDTRAPGFRKPVSNSAANSFDLRQGFVEFTGSGSGRWSLRAGRQELSFGAERLVGISNWSNVSRTFDALRLSYQTKNARLDWFASTLVLTNNDHFDRFRSNVKLHGFYSAFRDWLPDATIEPYLLWKSTAGDLDVYTFGVRALGPLPRRFDYNFETAAETGHAGSDDLRAWAGYWILGYKLGDGDRAPHVTVQYDFASGDSNPRDSHRRTFDQLYPTNHRNYGIADRIGWRNMHGAVAGVGFRPRRGLRLNIDYLSFWLANREDFLYASNGAAVVRNPQASSGHVSQEIDVYAVWDLSKEIELAFGYAHVFPGRFLKESTPGSPVTYPYVMWRYSFD
jgi:hypothetical protein